ncbi:11315_t:CDS:2 [Entrophospora sp. SA101]|nr:11315_t:CDS:2 [Entrophospora sp. SA101]CAJ0843919.1 9693_t:CDS:2 [Entrophospora sp. SA101]CAJ0906018.1 9246_t:CDS:2 [Entrophospora sp. SA101]CAJ0916115.1 3646_t:CDS:2 [Entrophospora sp. SA101]CAJ0916121.1 3648_t:CDS:2 [Entrophospora sp. SA101]
MAQISNSSFSLSPDLQKLFENINKQQLDLENQITKLNNVVDLLKQQEMILEIKEEVKDLDKWIEEVKSSADEQEKEKDKQFVLNKLKKNEEQFKQIQASIRRAILTSKQNIEKEFKHQREMLLSRKVNGDDNDYDKRDGVLKRRNFSDVTGALRRTTQLMQQEIERSVYSAKVLGLTSIIRSSKQLITKLEQSDWTDRLLILFGLLVFCMVVLYILKSRIWNTGISWVSWFTSWFI